MSKKIVCLGAGTGVSMVLSGLKKYPLDLTAVVTIFDDGWSSGKLKNELGIAPVGDIRQCLTALSPERNLASLFGYRFERGTFKGHCLGNLVIAAAIQQAGGLNEGIDRLRKVLNVKSKILPVALKNSTIKAVLKNGKIVSGEESIIHCSYLSRIGVKKIYLDPKVQANPRVIAAIKKADLIIIAPGKFYTSILPNFLVSGIPEVFRQTRAKKIFICNLLTQIGNTDKFGVEDFIREFEKYVGKDIIDHVIFNTGKLPPQKLKEVKKIFPGTNFIKYGQDLLGNKNYIGADVLDRNIRKLNPADTLGGGANQRTIVFHDSNKLAKIILPLCKL